MCSEIRFSNNIAHNQNYRLLRKEVHRVAKELPERRLVKKRIVAVVLPLLYFVLYGIAMVYANSGGVYITIFSVMGLLSVLIFLNIVHEAVHRSLFPSNFLNTLFLYVFDFIGGNSFIWAQRHMMLHHNFQNVAGWDSDIEQAGVIAIYPHAETTHIHKYQHWLIFFLYPLFLFNWVMLRDFKDFFLKDRLIKKAIEIPAREYIILIIFKLWFVTYTIIAPIYLGIPTGIVISGFCLMLLTGGVFAMLILLTPHANATNAFPLPNSSGELPWHWLQHQFKTTNDITMNNWFSRNLMGNFNFHLAHHLFPNISSVYAPEVTRVIEEFANTHKYSYRSYGLLSALKSHYELIKSNALSFDFFEDDM